MTNEEAIECLRKARFLPRLQSTTAEQAIDAMLGTLTDDPTVVDHAALRAAVLQRQEMEPPLLPGGIGLPHARTEYVKSLVMVIATTENPLPFGNATVRLLILIGVPKSAITPYLELTSFLARRLRNEDIVRHLWSASDLDSFVRSFSDS